MTIYSVKKLGAQKFATWDEVREYARIRAIALNAHLEKLKNGETYQKAVKEQNAFLDYCEGIRTALDRARAIEQTTVPNGGNDDLISLQPTPPRSSSSGFLMRSSMSYWRSN